MKKRICTLATLTLVAIGLLTASAGTAQAQYARGGYGYNPAYPAPGSGYGYSGSQGYSGPVYDPPSVHYDRVYHPTTTHWTPFRGRHTHGHFDVVPHYTPGHLDYQNGPYVQPNPYYHSH
jgi:hypothetical protein